MVAHVFWKKDKAVTQLTSKCIRNSNYVLFYIVNGCWTSPPKHFDETAWALPFPDIHDRRTHSSHSYQLLQSLIFTELGDHSARMAYLAIAWGSIAVNDDWATAAVSKYQSLQSH